MTARRLSDDARRRVLRSARSVTILVVALTAVACWPRRRAEEVVPRRSPARDSLLATDLRRVDSLALRGSNATLGSLLLPDAVYLRPGAPIVFGRENALALLASGGSIGGSIVAWQPMGAGVSRDGLSGYTFGISVHAPADRLAPPIERYIAFWSRARGGPWRIAAYAEIGTAPAASGRTVAGREVPARNLSRQAQELVSALMSADSVFAERSSMFGTATGFADAIAEDGVLLGAAELIVGPRSVREYFESQRGVSLIWRPIYAAGAASGDLGFTVGESVSTSRGPTGAAVQRFSKYLTIWRKEPNVGWRFVVDGGSSRPSPVGE